MSREFNRCAMALFSKGMAELGFSPDKAIGPLAWPGEKIFKATEGTPACWISIFPNHKGYNEFQLEFIWSRAGGFPVNLTSRPTPRAMPPLCFGNLGAGFLRMAGLCTPPLGSRALEESALLQQLSRSHADLFVPPLVNQALACVSSVGLQLVQQARSSSQPSQPQSGA
jgi:hypothetical protein